MEEYDVAVIGASVAGSRIANLVSKKGYNVLLIEEHKNIGLPLQCTGLVSFRLLELLPNLPKSVIINKVKSARFFSPNGNCLELKPKYPVYVIDRTALDRFLFNRAKNNVETRIGEKFESFRQMKDCVKIKTNKGIYASKILIGADGSNSTVRKQMKIEQKKSLLGLQTRIKGGFDPDSVELWFGSKICPDFFAWVVPENENIARIGLATNKNLVKFYNNFLKKRIGYVKRPDVAGRISYGLIDRTSEDRIMIAGDAAFQVKPFSGGGIIYGLIASEICADACMKSLEENRFDRKFFKKTYDDKWKKVLSLPIRKGLILRKLFDIAPDIELNFLFYAAGHQKKILEKWDMDLF
jgi:digeranylgeranylglycerophospholipid reductase